MDEFYGDPTCKHCKKSLVGEVVQYTLFECPKCGKTYELHAECAQQGCPDCRGRLVYKCKEQYDSGIVI